MNMDDVGGIKEQIAQSAAEIRADRQACGQINGQPMNRHTIVGFPWNLGFSTRSWSGRDDLRGLASGQLRLGKSTNLQFDATCPRQVTIADVGDSHSATFSLIAPKCLILRQTAGCVHSRLRSCPS